MLVFLFFVLPVFILARAKVENTLSGVPQVGKMIVRSIRINNGIIFALVCFVLLAFIKNGSNFKNGTK